MQIKQNKKHNQLINYLVICSSKYGIIIIIIYITTTFLIPSQVKLFFKETFFQQNLWYITPNYCKKLRFKKWLCFTMFNVDNDILNFFIMIYLITNLMQNCVLENIVYIPRYWQKHNAYIFVFCQGVFVNFGVSFIYFLNKLPLPATEYYA